MKNAYIIFKKQIKDTSRNIALCIQFVMYPVLAVILENAVQVENMPEHFFAGMFAVMHVGMGPLCVMTAVIAEEKEKNTLRILLFGGVKPVEYLFGVGAYILTACMAGGVVFALLGGYRGTDFLIFLSVMAMGIIVSILFGAVIGIYSKSQVSATTVATPLMMVFAFLPMLAMFNKTIAKVADLAYSQQIQLLFNHLQAGTAIESKSLIIIGINLAVAALGFTHAYRKCGLA